MFENGRLQAAETEVRSAVRDLRARKFQRFCIAFERELFDLRAARIPEADHLGNLIKGLAGSVIAGPRNDFIFPFFRNVKEVSMTTRNDQSKCGILYRRIFKND